ncbi:hypothetical protein J3R82DRAFT_10093 [Butyriboletus roseoflavus]|nr:hypothetical protein J3R82DRAFT_10093 [Butyriboletus roseoflavus]
MKALGELDHARDEIAWPTREAHSMEIPGRDPAEVIVAHEHDVHAGSGLKQETVEKAMDEARMHQLPSEIPVESPFHPTHYPSPWPLVSFESPYSPFALQRGIPTHTLPKKLHIHDPWNLVNVDSNDFYATREGSWTSKIDHVRTYTLSLSPELEILAHAASKAAAAAEDEALKLPETVFISPQGTEGPTKQPAIRAFLPERPRKPTEVPEAHLYLSLKGGLGTGHHSIVYEAELELPRDLFCESTYCQSCLDEQIIVEVDRLKESGEWERRLNEAAKEYQTTESRDSPSSSSIQIPPRYVGFVRVILEHVPMQTMDMVAPARGESGETMAPAADAPSQHFACVSEPLIKRYVQYERLIVPIHPNIQWQNPSFPQTLCEHNVGKLKPVPRTARFHVAAKLSLPYDPHLEREAHNYLNFPSHFFQHWTGYNVVPPLHDPTPVGALVPQFFGYYKPDPPSENEYCSPILLIEHCGKPISVEKLSTDDRHECAALLFRFHTAGWLHESFAKRNILMQKHHPTCSPLEEHQDQCDVPHQHRPHSFRLIDFGRSVEYDRALRRSQEEMVGKYLFGIL